MIIKKIKDTEIRVYRNDNGELLGIAGTLLDLENRGMLTYEGTGTPMRSDMWCCIDGEGNIIDFVQSNEAAKLIFMEI